MSLSRVGVRGGEEGDGRRTGKMMKVSRAADIKGIRDLNDDAIPSCHSGAHAVCDSEGKVS